MAETPPVLMDGAEPFFLPRGAVGCLLIHGFTASPQEVRWMGEFLAAAGISVLAPRLAGHGTHLGDLSRSRWRDWYASALDGYHLLQGHCSRIVVAGLSLGGALALLLASQHPPLGVIAMSTPRSLLLDRTMRRLWPWMPLLAVTKRYTPEGPPDWRDPEVGRYRVHYQAYPVRAVREVEKALSRMRAALPELRVPALFIHSRQDDFVTPEHAQSNFQAYGGGDKELRWVENSNHIITCDAERQRVFAAGLEFIQRLVQADHAH